MEDSRWARWLEPMRLALALANDAVQASHDVPVGAVVAQADGYVIGRGGNAREATADPTAHAELVAIRDAAGRLGTWRLDGCTLVTTLEPCLMCAGGALSARVSRIVFGAWDPKAGACGSVWDLPRDRSSPHRAEVIGGLLAADSAALLDAFFAARRG